MLSLRFKIHYTKLPRLPPLPPALQHVPKDPHCSVSAMPRYLLLPHILLAAACSQLTQEMLQLAFKITADPWHRSRASPYVRCCAPQGRGDGFRRRWGRREEIAQPQQHLVTARMCGRWWKGGTRPSVCLSARRAAWYLALAVQHCQPVSPGMEQAAPLCQPPRGTGAECLLQKSSTTGGIGLPWQRGLDGALCSSRASAPSLSCSLRLFCSFSLS